MKKNVAMEKKMLVDSHNNQQAKERLMFAASNEESILLAHLETAAGGLSEMQVDASRVQYGDNVITHGKVNPLFQRILDAFVNPFTIILFVLAIVSVFTDIVLVAPGEENYVTVTIITAMVMISGILRFIQETRSGNAAAKLQQLV